MAELKLRSYEATLGSPGDFWDMVKNNVVQLAVNGEGYSPGRMPLTSVIGLPFEIEGYPLVRQNFDKAFFLRQVA